jgi:predicted dehydrogenase
MNYNRRKFLKLSSIGVGAGILGLNQSIYGQGKKPVIQGFDEISKETSTKTWIPISDRKIKVGLVGYGACKFGAEFGFQDHPNVEVVAVSDLIPSRCSELAKVTRCNKTYPSLEELVKDDNIEAVFVATDAPSHARHCIEVLKHGKHVACAVPAVYGSLEDAYELFEVVTKSAKSGLKYMMFETSMFRADLYAMRTLYKSGHLGEIVYSEGEYYHYSALGHDSFKGWRIGGPPQFYPTHSNAYYLGVTGGSFTEVSCLGKKSILERYQPENNIYKNPFGTEIALFKTSDGSISRMAVSFDTPGFGRETGRIRGTKGSFFDNRYAGLEKKENLPDLERPPLPPNVSAGGHGGSHGRLTDEFVSAILQDRKPLVDIDLALNLTVSGIIAHHSALKDGEWLKIPQFKL